jgi:hypothetical protein
MLETEAFYNLPPKYFFAYTWLPYMGAQQNPIPVFSSKVTIKKQKGQVRLCQFFGSFFLFFPQFF